MPDAPRRSKTAGPSHAAMDAQAPSLPGADVTWDLLSEKINDVIVLADTTGRIFYASPACRTLGYAQHELIGRAPAEFVHPDDLERFEANTAALFSGAPQKAVRP